MKKHISLVMSYPFKPELAAGNRMISLANAAREKGYQVTIYSLKDDSLKQKRMMGTIVSNQYNSFLMDL